jgi:type III pantothenate kinase
VDIGNQYAKFLKFNADGTAGVPSSFPTRQWEHMMDLPEHQNATWIISDVSRSVAKTNRNRVYMLSVQMKWPFEMAYHTPHSIGFDRLCGLAGALFLDPESQCHMVISLGTCITIDTIDENNIYHGGNISPGMLMRYKALHTFTANLPLLDCMESPPYWGFDTHTAIHAGVQHGIIAEINQYIEGHRYQFPYAPVYLSGGDALYFMPSVKKKINTSPFLNLYGLYSIAKLNEIF